MRKPKGKDIFGLVTVGSKGQIVIPKKARDVFGIEPGVSLVLVGDEKEGLAIITNERVSRMLQTIIKEEPEDDGNQDD